MRKILVTTLATFMVLAPLTGALNSKIATMIKSQKALTSAQCPNQDAEGNCLPCSLKCAHANETNFSVVEEYGAHFEDKLSNYTSKISDQASEITYLLGEIKSANSQMSSMQKQLSTLQTQYNTDTSSLQN